MYTLEQAVTTYQNIELIADMCIISISNIELIMDYQWIIKD